MLTVYHLTAVITHQDGETVGSAPGRRVSRSGPPAERATEKGVDMRLTGKKIAILLAEGVEDLEFYVPAMRLQEEGAEVLAAGVTRDPIRGKHGLEISPTTTIGALDAAGLFALVVPGGWAPDALRRIAAVTDLVRDMDAAGKTIGIICHGGLVPISAGILRGRRATGSRGIKDDLTNAGAIWVDEPAFREGNLVWGRVVDDIPAFCRELVAALVEAAGTELEAAA
jgi:protease I